MLFSNEQFSGLLCFLYNILGMIFSNFIETFNIMSSAFVKESEEQWLHEVMPTLNALIHYLTRQNNGVRVYERNNFIDTKLGKTVYGMSNGASYSIDNNGKWYIL